MSTKPARRAQLFMSLREAEVCHAALVDMRNSAKQVPAHLRTAEILEIELLALRFGNLVKQLRPDEEQPESER